MALIGDVGGFNSAMILIPTYLIGYFSFITYRWDVTKEMPVKMSDSKASKNNPLLKKLSSNYNEQRLQKDDVKCLRREASLLAKPMMSWLKSLCHVGWLCRPNRRLRLQIQQFDKFEG